MSANCDADLLIPDDVIANTGIPTTITNILTIHFLAVSPTARKLRLNMFIIKLMRNRNDTMKIPSSIIVVINSPFKPRLLMKFVMIFDTALSGSAVLPSSNPKA